MISANDNDNNAFSVKPENKATPIAITITHTFLK